MGQTVVGLCHVCQQTDCCCLWGPYGEGGTVFAVVVVGLVVGACCFVAVADAGPEVDVVVDNQVVVDFGIVYTWHLVVVSIG